MHTLFRRLAHLDWVLIGSIVPIVLAGLVTMYSFTGPEVYFSRQLIWVGVAFVALLVTALFDYSLLTRTPVLVALYTFMVVVLFSLGFVGTISKGAQSWFNLGFFSIQPSDPAKILLILVLAKYFSRRHVAIGHIRHIIVSGIYAFIIFLLVLLQPDFGSAVIIFLIWLGMVMVSGLSKKHLVLIALVGAAAASMLWFFVFQDYQRARVLSFLHPLADVRGAGYNAYQSTIAVGSGEMLGKGIGFGTQSRLQFLPEYETDFIFAAFAEEWGFIGCLVLLTLYALVLWRLITLGMRGARNFETLYAVGVAILLLSHITINVGMNIGLLPVTGVVLPFMSYGGSHLVTEFIALGLVMSMRRRALATHRAHMHNEFIGPQ
jgi:rod shape determining protein RodA